MDIAWHSESKEKLQDPSDSLPSFLFPRHLSRRQISGIPGSGKADNVGCFDVTPGSFVLRGQNKVRDPVWSSGPKCRRCRCLLWGWTRSGAGEMRQGRRARRTRVAEVNLNLVDPPPPILVRSNYPLETWSAKAGRVPSREPENVPQRGYSHTSHFSPARSRVPLLPLSPLAPANLVAR